MKTVRPKVRCRVRTSSSKSPAPMGSRPEVGSSRNTSSGSSASAPASATRLIMPPESFGGKPVGHLGTHPPHAELGRRNLVEQPLREVEIFAHRELDILPHGER